jgi:hypothetical protein
MITSMRATQQAAICLPPWRQTIDNDQHGIRCAPVGGFAFQ